MLILLRGQEYFCEDTLLGRPKDVFDGYDKTYWRSKNITSYIGVKFNIPQAVCKVSIQKNGKNSVRTFMVECSDDMINWQTKYINILPCDSLIHEYEFDNNEEFIYWRIGNLPDNYTLDNVEYSEIVMFRKE